MFKNMGVHVLKNPAGTYSFVGRIPASLGNKVPANREDIMGGRAFDDSGRAMTYKFPVFKTEHDARKHAKNCGVELSN